MGLDTSLKLDTEEPKSLPSDPLQPRWEATPAQPEALPQHPPMGRYVFEMSPALVNTLL